ncbi:putative uncharacterized protein [Clostridium sp. CAG:914]|nr:putative uncharacterized protein [Clostridium sp. CAG:914]
MKYVLLRKKVFAEEIKSRQEYLYDIFKVYTIPFYFDNYVELRSIPENFGNIIFINGHNGQVHSYLMSKKIEENVIVMITCYQGLVQTVNLNNKKMFFTDITTDKLNGKEYGFNFEITNSELNLYNCPYTSLNDKIEYSFERIR